LTQYFRRFLSKNGSNWASLPPKFAFAHNTRVNTATGSTPYEIVFGSKPQIPLSPKLGFVRDTRKLCHSDFCEGLPPHSHNTSQTNTSLDRLLHKCPSPSFFTRENQFNRLYAETYRVSRETTDKANEYRNEHKLGKELHIGKKSFATISPKNSINQRNCVLSVQAHTRFSERLQLLLMKLS